MNEIAIGEYVRTNRGIGKILEIKTVQPKMYGKYDIVYLIDVCPRMYISDSNFIKHSKNIIDLIEIGDYVNGRKIERVNDYGEHKRADFNLDFDDCDAVYNEDIKSIVTKEQFKATEYKV